MAKNLPANAGDARDVDVIPGLGRSLEEKMATHSSVLAWRMQWTEVPGGLQSRGWQRVRHDWEAKHTLTYCAKSFHCTKFLQTRVTSSFTWIPRNANS